jgi:hypothetical protein
MTRPRADISASLAERGLAEWWANQAETAALCGLSTQEFVKKLPELEARGFPPVVPANGKRFIPHIRRFWEAEASARLPADPAAVQDEERAKENLRDQRPPRQRFSA